MNKQLETEMIYSSIFSDKLIDGTKFFGKYCSFYPFTTENIRGLLSVYNVENKDILLPCSSSDHIFNFLLQNPKNIINSLTIHLFYLKKACILSLNNEEYINFFYTKKRNKNSLSIDKYIKARKYLPQKEKLFWDSLYKVFSDKELRNSYLFYKPEYLKNEIKAINPYLDKDNYNQIKKDINKYNIDFINDDIINIPKKLEKKYDFIYLSHMAFYRFNPETLYYTFDNFLDKLNQNGDIGLIYLYNYKDPYFDNTQNDLYNSTKREKIFSKNKFSYLEFKDVINQSSTKKRILKIGDKDAVLNYHKNN